MEFSFHYKVIIIRRGRGAGVRLCGRGRGEEHVETSWHHVDTYTNVQKKKRGHLWEYVNSMCVNVQYVQTCALTLVRAAILWASSASTSGSVSAFLMVCWSFCSASSNLSCSCLFFSSICTQTPQTAKTLADSWTTRLMRFCIWLPADFVEGLQPKVNKKYKCARCEEKSHISRQSKLMYWTGSYIALIYSTWALYTTCYIHSRTASTCKWFLFNIHTHSNSNGCICEQPGVLYPAHRYFGCELDQPEIKPPTSWWPALLPETQPLK